MSVQLREPGLLPWDGLLLRRSSSTRRTRTKMCSRTWRCWAERTRGRRETRANLLGKMLRRGPLPIDLYHLQEAGEAEEEEPCHGVCNTTRVTMTWCTTGGTCTCAWTRSNSSTSLTSSRRWRGCLPCRSSRQEFEVIKLLLVECRNISTPSVEMSSSLCWSLKCLV